MLTQHKPRRFTHSRFRSLLLLILMTLWSAALASHYTGTYTDPSGMTVILQQDAQGDFQGQWFTADGGLYKLQGNAFSDALGEGTAQSASETLNFNLTMSPDANTITFYVAGEAAAIQEIAFTRQSHDGTFRPEPAPLSPEPEVSPQPPVTPDKTQVNPLDPPQDEPAVNPLDPGGEAQNPLAVQDPLVGRYSDGQLAVTFEGGAGQYSGQIVLNEQTYPLEAQGSAEQLEGTFRAAGNPFTFTASLQGDTLTLMTGGASYVLEREAVNPLSQP